MLPRFSFFSRVPDMSSQSTPFTQTNPPGGPKLSDEDESGDSSSESGAAVDIFGYENFYKQNGHGEIGTATDPEDEDPNDMVLDDYMYARKRSHFLYNFYHYL